MLKIWVGNLGKYNEGKLVGGWIELPQTKEKLDEFLKNVVELNEEYEEYLINDFETDLPYKVTEYESISELNLLAKVADEVENMDKVRAYIEAQGDLSKLELMNVMKQEDKISYYYYIDDVTNASKEHKFGYTKAEELGIAQMIEENELSFYFDYEKYGNDRSIDTNVVLLEDGFVDLDECNIEMSLYDITELMEEYDIEVEKEKVKVIYKEVSKDPVVIEIDNTLEAKQKLVGGLIEVVKYKEDLLLVCNEEGKCLNMKPNLKFDYDYIAGNCFIIGDDWENEGFKSIPEDKIEEIIKDLKERTILEEITEESEDDMEL